MNNSCYYLIIFYSDFDAAGWWRVESGNVMLPEERWVCKGSLESVSVTIMISSKKMKEAVKENLKAKLGNMVRYITENIM